MPSATASGFPGDDLPGIRGWSTPENGVDAQASPPLGDATRAAGVLGRCARRESTVPTITTTLHGADGSFVTAHAYLVTIDGDEVCADAAQTYS